MEKRYLMKQGKELLKSVFGYSNLIFFREFSILSNSMVLIEFSSFIIFFV